MTQKNGEGPPEDDQQEAVPEEDWKSSEDQDATRVRPEMAYEKDQKFFRNVAHYLGATLIISLTLVGVLAICEIEVPQMLVAVASGILGIFGAMFGFRGK